MFLFLTFREKMVPQEMVPQVVLASRSVSRVYDVHSCAHDNWLCLNLFILNISIFFRVILGPVEILVSL